MADDDDGLACFDPTVLPQPATISGHRRGRSNTEISNYSLPTSFNMYTTDTYFRSHRPKDSESSIETDETLASEVLMSFMTESAYHAVNSRPRDLLKTRRSFADERSAAGAVNSWI